MKTHKDIEQKSDEWFAIRKGKMTASHGQAIASNGKGLDTYIVELMSEYYSSGERDYYSNKHMERGNELEDQARTIYELETKNDVEQVGFIEYNDFAGCSPDGLVGKDGMMEIKCPDDKGHFKTLLNGKSEIATKYHWQMQMQMLISSRDWCDFVSYNPNFEKSTFIFRVFKDSDKFIKILQGLESGKKMIKKIKEDMNV